MDFALSEENRLVQDLVRRFVNEQLIPLETAVLKREASGEGAWISAEERSRVDARARELGLWGLDAPADIGGADLPSLAMIGVNIEMGRTATPYYLPPDSPNLRMLIAAANEDQKERYLKPYVRDGLVSAIGISEPGAGADPSGMVTTATRSGADWVINGRKIWISRAEEADFTILMAVTDRTADARGRMSAFLIDKGTPGFRVGRRIPMLGGQFTYEVVLDDCRVPAANLLGAEGKGFAPMQVRLGVRRLQMAAWSIGMAERALDMMLEDAPQRRTFGAPLSERQTVQGWISRAALGIRTSRLLACETAWRLDRGEDVRTEISMLKSYATETAWSVLDDAMQLFGAMGVSKELPLALMAGQIRTMRIYDGPTEIHDWVVARNLLAGRGAALSGL